MPLYEYRCDSCGFETEVMQRVNATPLATSEKCGGAMKKLASAPAIQFKGSGWYVTDYAGSGKRKDAVREASSETPAAPAESKPADTKPADSKPADSKPADAKPAATPKAS